LELAKLKPEEANRKRYISATYPEVLGAHNLPDPNNPKPKFLWPMSRIEAALRLDYFLHDASTCERAEMDDVPGRAWGPPKILLSWDCFTIQANLERRQLGDRLAVRNAEVLGSVKATIWRVSGDEYVGYTEGNGKSEIASDLKRILELSDLISWGEFKIEIFRRKLSYYRKKNPHSL
jgi:hypothetical protein